MDIHQTIISIRLLARNESMSPMKPWFVLAEMSQKTRCLAIASGLIFLSVTVRCANRPLSPYRPNDFALLICRVVRAMRAMRAVRVPVLGLDSQWGPPLRSGFHPQPPIRKPCKSITCFFIFLKCENQKPWQFNRYMQKVKRMHALNYSKMM